MPWSEVSVMDQRREFVRLALQEGANRRELCRRFGISPEVGLQVAEALAGRRSGTRRSVASTACDAQAQRGCRRGAGAGGTRQASGLGSPQDRPLSEARRADRTGALHGASDPVPERRIKPSESAPPNPGHRFEKEAPNQLWQMDFKGHMPLRNGTRLPSADDGRRSLPLCLVPEGLRERAASYRAGPSDSHLPPLWPAGRLLHRQRLAVGRHAPAFAGPG